MPWNVHIRHRPGMYIGKLGNGTSADDGIYMLTKEVIDNSVDEFIAGYGRTIEVTIEDKTVTVRDFGRGLPLGKVVELVSVMNTGSKYETNEDKKVFKKSGGLNGVGTKVVNALSSHFEATSYRDGKSFSATFSAGNLLDKNESEGNAYRNGTLIRFTPDEEVFGPYEFNLEIIEQMLRNYSYVNAGLTIKFNGQTFLSKDGLLDLLKENLSTEPLYAPIHLRGEDIELVITHSSSYGEVCYSFANGQYTVLGGTHLMAFREGFTKTIKEFYNKDFDAADIRASMVAAISLRVDEPVFESQTKTKLGSKDMGLQGPSIRQFVGDFIKKELDNYLHKHPDTAESLLKKIQESERERKEISGIQKKSRETAKKVSLNNRKVRDCRYHLNDKNPLGAKSMIFITEGDSASGSITKSRDANYQAVFSLKGKPLNCYGLTRKVVYENTEFNLLQAALNIEESMDNLRYDKVIVATDADVDGMHIRLLMLTFFMQFFPELIRQGHVYILQTPLFRVRNKKETRYCYTDEERQMAIAQLSNPEITRFKGLGEISPDEFKNFIDDNMRLEQVKITKDDPIMGLLEFYMGKNTADRKDFIIDNLKIETDLIEELQAAQKSK
ncbi:MAG: type IIA DNA topoisomerase subunit B [Rikenellaceae bacterium]|nr:type IIA DNA topoisomerase subunit B [Rikenellaceae bacterium]